MAQLAFAIPPTPAEKGEAIVLVITSLIGLAVGLAALRTFAQAAKRQPLTVVPSPSAAGQSEGY